MLLIFKESRTILAFVFGCVFAGCVTTEEEFEQQHRKEVRSAYESADSNGDRKVSKSELAEYMHREALAEFDLNSDSSISKHEWTVTRQAPESDGEAFNQLDADGDGEVRGDEATSYIAGQARFDSAFDQIDQDEDGFLAWEEYKIGDSTILDVSLFSPAAPEPSSE